jgi:hypothetical protein
MDQDDAASAAIYRIIPKKWPNADGHFQHPRLPAGAPVERPGRPLVSLEDAAPLSLMIAGKEAIS